MHVQWPDAEVWNIYVSLRNSPAFFFFFFYKSYRFRALLVKLVNVWVQCSHAETNSIIPHLMCQCCPIVAFVSFAANMLCCAVDNIVLWFSTAVAVGSRPIIGQISLCTVFGFNYLCWKLTAWALSKAKYFLRWYWFSLSVSPSINLWIKASSCMDSRMSYHVLNRLYYGKRMWYCSFVLLLIFMQHFIESLLNY